MEREVLELRREDVVDECWFSIGNEVGKRSYALDTFVTRGSKTQGRERHYTRRNTKKTNRSNFSKILSNLPPTNSPS